MTDIERLQKLQSPKGSVDVVLDTDTYNEIDDQYAVAYLLKAAPRLHTKALLAAPFHTDRVSGPKEGMEQSYNELLHLLELMGREDMKSCVFRGSDRFLPDEHTPVESDAARHLCELAMTYPTDRPLYVAAIGAITNVASAILMQPEIVDHIVVVWLGGHALHWPNSDEFNMKQDVAAARVVFGCGVPLVWLPAAGVVSSFTVTEPELREWFFGKNALCEYLAQHTVDYCTEKFGTPRFVKVIWDVTTIGWLLGGTTDDRLIPAPIPEYDNHYGIDDNRHLIRYVYNIRHTELLNDLIDTLTQ